MATNRFARYNGMLASLGAGAWLSLAYRGDAIGDPDGAIGMVRVILPVLLLLAGLVGLSTRHPARLEWAAWTVGIAACGGGSLLIVSQIGSPWTVQGATAVSPALLPVGILALGSFVYGLAVIGAPGIDRVAAAALILGSPAPLFAFAVDRGAIATTFWLIFGAGWLVVGLLLWWDARPALGWLRPTFCPRRYVPA